MPPLRHNMIPGMKFATATEIARQNPDMSTLEVLRATNAAISGNPRAIGAPPSVGARVGAMAYDTLTVHTGSRPTVVQPVDK